MLNTKLEMINNELDKVTEVIKIAKENDKKLRELNQFCSEYILYFLKTFLKNSLT